MSMTRLTFPVGYQESNKGQSFNGYKRTPKIKRLVNIMMILLVLAAAVVIFVYRENIAALGNLGYIGVFLISLISCATIFLPVPGILLIFAFGAIYNPVAVGIVAALGGTLGEGFGYILGFNGCGLMSSSEVFKKTERWIRKWGAVIIFVFSVVPTLPIDIIGITAGGLRYPVWKFFVVCIFGKALLYTGMAFAGAWGWESLLRYFGF